MPKRTNPLFFKQDGGMDLSQFILLVIVGWIVCVFSLAGLQVLAYTTAAWAFLGSFTSLAFIAWAAHDRASLIANSKTPGEVAKGIATATPPYAGMDAGEKDADD
jgi:hypothetical protein